VRIVIEIEPTGKAVVSTEPAAVAMPADSGAEEPSGTPEPVDAGPPAAGESLESASETQIYGEAVDAGPAPAIAAGESGPEEARAEGEDTEPVDAGGAPDFG
jgi:hypothetical protein